MGVEGEGALALQPAAFLDQVNEVCFFVTSAVGGGGGRCVGLLCDSETVVSGVDWSRPRFVSSGDWCPFFFFFLTRRSFLRFGQEKKSAVPSEAAVTGSPD